MLALVASAAVTTDEVEEKESEILANLGTVFVEDGGVLTYSLPAGNGSGGVVLREFLSVKEGVTPEGIEQSPTRVSYFIGNDTAKWRSGLTTYNAVSLGEVCAGTTLSLKAYGSNVENIFTVEPSANPEAIRVRVESSADALRVNESSGELEIATEAGVVRFSKPVAFQVSADGTGEEEVAAYKVYDQETYEFSVGDYDIAHPLIIDPLLASIFVGGSDYEHAYAIDTANGNVFVAGHAYSSGYPTTAGAFDASHNGGEDVFVSKLDGELSKICACDADGNPKEQFAPGQTVHVWGNGLEASTQYKLWIQEEAVSEGETLVPAEDPSEAQETAATDGSGTLAVTGIWAIDANASATSDEWDIVADNQDAGTVGTYNDADDGIDSASVAGFTAPVPELATIVLFSIGLVVLAGYVWLRKRF